MRITNILLLLFSINSLFAQEIDTIYNSDNDLVGLNKVNSIIYTIGDTTRIVRYWKGEILSIKYEANIKGCYTPILTDTIYSEYDGTLLSTNHHKIIHLSENESCDSLLRIVTEKGYRNGNFLGIVQYKYVGFYGKCLCGNLEIYKDNEVVTKKMIPCESRIIDNITLTNIFWSPDSSYYVELYREKLLMAMPGQGGDHSATIVLKHKSGNTIKVVSSASSESVLHRDIHNINWEQDKNKLGYAPARNIEWINEENIDLEIMRKKINRFIGNEYWDYYKKPEVFGDRCYVIGEFYGEPESNRSLDMAVLIKDSIGQVKLLIIDNYNYHLQEEFEFVVFENKGDYSSIGNFKAVRKGQPIWSNWEEGKGDDGHREFKDVPANEVEYLPYDAIYMHVAEACGGGFIFWKDSKWNWLQQE